MSIGQREQGEGHRDLASRGEGHRDPARRGEGHQDPASRGSAAVEFALVLPVIALFLLAAVEVVVVARTRVELLSAAREGARVAATTPDPARAVDAVKGALSPPLAEAARVSVTRPGVVGRPALVVVTVLHRLAPFLVGGVQVEISARAVMRVER